jgi:hypothetical protein
VKRNYHIAIAGVLAIAAYLFLMRGKGQQYLVKNDVLIPNDPSTPLGVERLQERPTLIPKGDVISGTITEELVDSAPGTFGPTVTQGVRVSRESKSTFIPITNLRQV